jgi:hypothetical protein
MWVALSVRSRLRCWIIAACVVLLAGCSTLRLAYNQAPHLLYWWLNNYVDFEPEQGERARDAVAEWFRWHRATQLADYTGLLAAAQQQILQDVTPPQVCKWADDLRRRLDVAYGHGVPALAETVRSLRPDQIGRIERRHRKGDEEFRDDYLQPTRAEQLEAANKRTLSRVEFIYGRLNEPQRALLARGIAESPFDAQRWFAERQARQREIVETLRKLHAERAEQPRFEAALRTFAAHAAQSPRSAYRDYQTRLLAHNCQLLANLHNITTPEQRRHGADKLKGWEDDLRALMPSP